MRILIAGCGYVGTALGRRLADAGHEVWGLRRDPSGLPPEIRPLALDLVSSDLEGRLPPVDAVVYAASADETSPEAYERAYVQGPGRLIAALAGPDAPIERFLFVSSTAVYGDAGGGWVDEDTPPEPTSFRGQLVLRGEELVRSAPFRTSVVRLGGIYGPGRTRLLERVRKGEARCPEDGGRWTNRIHRDDAAGILEHLLDIEEPAPVYIGVDEAPTRTCEVYVALAEMLGVPGPGVVPEDPSDRPDRRCSSSRIRASGYRFGYPTFREGYRRMLEEGA